MTLHLIFSYYCSVKVLTVSCGAEHTIALCQEGVSQSYPHNHTCTLYMYLLVTTGIV